MLQITALFFYKHFIFDLYEKVIFQTVICIVCDKIFFSYFHFAETNV